jgi:hypothetical protein
MTDPQRNRIVAAFDRELADTPVPPELRSQAVRAAVAARSERRHPRQQWALALVATVIAFAIVATLVLGTRALHTVPSKVPPPGPPPSPRGEAGVAYDEAHGQMVLFGGRTESQNFLDETWTFDGKAWTQMHPKVSPPGRQMAGMAYDAARHQVVLVGGTINQPGKTVQVPLNDTWTWDGRAWTQQHPANNAPAVQQNMALAYDPISRMVIAFYVESQGNSTPHTLGWNGTDWLELHPATQPPSSYGSFAWDGTRLIFLGSPQQEGGRYLTKTWAWDGSNWTRLSSSVNQPPAQLFATAFDAANGRVIAVSGGETWTWDGTTWTRLSLSKAPAGAPYMAYFPSLRKVLAWGDRWSSRTGDLWSWDGSTWTLLQAVPSTPPANSPTTTMSPALADTYIRKWVTTARPVLLPSQLPAGFVEASVSPGADSFTVEYRTDQRDKSIYFGIVVANPPPGTKQTVTQALKFRGVTAQYQVYDPASPLSRRWLMWNEPGTMATQMTKAAGVPYFLSTDGLTDQEFWQLANSLK